MTIMAKVVETNDSDEEPSNSEDALSASEDEIAGNAGWADSIAKILKTNKPKGKKTLVLSRAKKLTDIKPQKSQPAGFEVATADGTVKEERVVIEEPPEPGPPRKKKRDLPSVRVKPNILDRDRERTLAKIATRGVVQLFNVVKMQQKDISRKLEEAGPLEVRKEKVLKSIDKRAFLDVLMGEKSQSAEERPRNVAKKDEGVWSVLRDDFMMGAKLKDWDKEPEGEGELEQQVEAELE